MNFFKKIRIISLSLVLAAVLLSTVSLAWLAVYERAVYTEYLRVETPPILYVCNYEADKRETVKVLDLENITLGQTKRIVFCIVPRTNELVDVYDLQLIYTQNLGEDITLYRVTEVAATRPASGTFETVSGDSGTFYYTFNPSAPMIPNSTEKPQFEKDGQMVDYDGEYHLFTNQAFTIFNNTVLPANTEGLKMNCYVLEISWPGNVAPVGIDPKEVDIVYIVVKGS